MNRGEYKVRKVLLIDDSIMDCMVNEHVLMQSHFAEKITIKYSAEAAVEHLRKNISHPEELPDFIFLDLVMPKVDGFDFMKKYAELDGIIHYYCSIIILSSNQDFLDYQRSIGSPFVADYLKKPLQIEQLLQTLTK